MNYDLNISKHFRTTIVNFIVITSITGKSVLINYIHVKIEGRAYEYYKYIAYMYYMNSCGHLRGVQFKR